MFGMLDMIPCPFCGHNVMEIADCPIGDRAVTQLYRVWVECCKCGGRGPYAYDAAKAVLLWNKQFDKQVLEVYKTVINHIRFHNGEFADGRLDGNGLSVAIMNELALLNHAMVPNNSNGGNGK